MIRYHVTMPTLKEIENELGMQRDKSRLVLKQAINKTADEIRKPLVKEARGAYIIKYPGKMARSLKINPKATAKRLRAVVTSEGGVNDLYNFHVDPSTVPDLKHRPPEGHKARGLKARTLQQTWRTPGQHDKHKAFVVKFKSGHMALAQRNPDVMRGQKADRYGKTHGNRPEHPNGEEAMRSLVGPSIPQMLGSEERVWSVVSPQMDQIMMKNIEKYMTKALKYKEPKA